MIHDRETSALIGDISESTPDSINLQLQEKFQNYCLLTGNCLKIRVLARTDENI